jgi:hypothetical protein
MEEQACLAEDKVNVKIQTTEEHHRYIIMSTFD